MAKPVVLVTASGIGVAPPGPGNAVSLAKTPNLDELWYKYPHGEMNASGVYIGFPESTPGNLRYGALTIGSGRSITQEKLKIDNAIRDETLKENPIIQEAIQFQKLNKGSFHLITLVTKDTYHSTLQHLYHFLKILEESGISGKIVKVHAIIQNSLGHKDDELLEELESYLLSSRTGVLASIIGKNFLIKNSPDFHMLKTAHGFYFNGTYGLPIKNWQKQLEEFRKTGGSTNGTLPLRIVYEKEDDSIEPVIKDGDVLFGLAYTQSTLKFLFEFLENKDFNYWETKSKTKINSIYSASLGAYSKRYPSKIAFKEDLPEVNLSKYLSERGVRQFKVAESLVAKDLQFYMNGYSDQVYKNETWLEVPSAAVFNDYADKPDMKNEWISYRITEALKKDTADFYFANFCAPYYVSTSNNVEATVKAIESLDFEIGEIATEVFRNDGTLIFTSEFGKAEEMINVMTGDPNVTNTTNKVPILIANSKLESTELLDSTLSDLAPTVISLLGLEPSENMQGRSLV